MIPDMECSWWPDVWLGYSLTQCCIDHDLGASDEVLFSCVSDIAPILIPVGALMWVGIKLGRPIYMKIKQVKS